VLREEEEEGEGEEEKERVVVPVVGSMSYAWRRLEES